MIKCSSMLCFNRPLICNPSLQFQQDDHSSGKKKIPDTTQREYPVGKTRQWTPDRLLEEEEASGYTLVFLIKQSSL